MEAVFMNSGGVDSLALAITMAKQGCTLHSLYLNFDLPASEAMREASKKIADKYCASHTVIDAKGLAPAEDDMKQKTVRFQPFIVAIYGCSYAYKLGLTYVITGNRCELINESFEKTFTDCINSYEKNEQIILRPLINVRDYNQLYAIVKDDDLLKSTVSCGKDPKCGSCIKCTQRQKFGID